MGGSQPRARFQWRDAAAASASEAPLPLRDASAPADHRQAAEREACEHRSTNALHPSAAPRQASEPRVRSTPDKVQRVASETRRGEIK